MKRPAFQMYPGDWFKDRQLRMCSIPTRGVWIDLLLAIKAGDAGGSITGTIEQLARIPGASLEEMRLALDELRDTGAATVTERNKKITVTNRRTAREHRDAELNANRQASYRSRHRNAPKKQASNEKVTIPSSSSTSTSSSTAVLPAENGTDDPTEIIHRTLAEIVPNHPKSSPLPWAVAAVEREVASNRFDAKEFCEALKKTHVEHCKIYERELNENPRAFVPLFHKWVSDGYYLHRPSNRDPPVKKPSYAQAVAAGLVTNLEEYERRFHA